MFDNDWAFLNNELNISEDYLSEFYDGEKQDALAMLDMFLKTSLVDMPKLRMLYDKEAFDDLRQLVHRIKPTFMMIGLRQMTKNFKSFEVSVDNREMEKIKRFVEHYTEKISDVEQVVKEEMKRLKN